MKDLKEIFKVRKNLVTLIVSLVLLIALPAGLYLVRNPQIFSPKAVDLAGSSVTILKDGATVNNTTINTHDVRLRINYQAPSALLPNTSLIKTAQNVLVPEVKAQEYLGCYSGEATCPFGYHCDWFNPNSDQDGCVPDSGGGGTTQTCNPFDANGDQEYDRFVYCAACGQEIWACSYNNYSPAGYYDFGDATGRCDENSRPDICVTQQQPCNASPNCNGAVCEPSGFAECGSGSRQCMLTTYNGSTNCTPATIEQTGCIVGCSNGASCVNGQCEQPTTCTPANPSVSVNPTQFTGHPGDSWNEEISITNNNSNGCNPEDFIVRMSDYTGNDVLFEETFLDVSSGQNVSSGVGAYILPERLPGVYTYSITVSPTSYSGYVGLTYMTLTVLGEPDDCDEEHGNTACWIGAQCSANNQLAANSACSSNHSVDGSQCNPTNDGPYADGCSQGYPQKYRITEGGQVQERSMSGGTNDEIAWTLSPGNGQKTVQVDFWLNNAWHTGSTSQVNVQAGTTGGTDLTVGSLSPLAVPTRTNVPVQIHGTVFNLGSTAVTTPFRVNLTTINVPGLAPQAITLNGVGANNTADLQFPTNNTITTVGSFDYRVCVDTDSQITETNEDNNCAIGVLNIEAPDGTGTNLDLGITADPSCELNNNITARRVTLNWRLLSGANSYKVERNGQVITTTQAQTGLSTTSFIYADFPGTGTFNYVVKAFSGGGGSGTLMSTSQSVAITVASCDGVTFTACNLVVNPNPVNVGSTITFTPTSTNPAFSYQLCPGGANIAGANGGLVNPVYTGNSVSYTAQTPGTYQGSQRVAPPNGSCSAPQECHSRSYVIQGVGSSPVSSTGGCVSIPGSFTCPSIAPISSTSPVSSANGGRACPVLGDASDPCDSHVTGLDFQRWADEFTGRLTTKRANFNPEVDNSVTGIDFQIWLSQFLRGI